MFSCFDTIQTNRHLAIVCATTQVLRGKNVTKQMKLKCSTVKSTANVDFSKEINDETEQKRQQKTMTRFH